MSLWKAYRLPEPIAEYKFHPTRKWRFDYAWPQHKIAVEIEGGLWRFGYGKSGGAHSRPANIMRDMEKQNAAGEMGWRIFRFTPAQWKNGHVFSLMGDILK